MSDQSLTSVFSSAASSAYVINFQCPKISHIKFNFQSDRINVKVGKNFKIYRNILMIKSNYSTIKNIANVKVMKMLNDKRWS